MIFFSHHQTIPYEITVCCPMGNRLYKHSDVVYYPCGGNITCGEYGVCKPYRGNESLLFCECTTYRDPTTYCRKTVFQMEEYFASMETYLCIVFVLYTITLCCFVLEFLTDLLYNRCKAMKQENTITKLVSIIYHVLRLTSSFLFAWGYANTSIELVEPQIGLHLCSIVFLLMGYLIAAISWLSMLLKARGLDAIPKPFRIIRIIYIILICISFPTILVNTILSNLNIFQSITSLIGLYGAIVVIIVTCTINIICSMISIKMLAGVIRMQTMEKKQNRYKMVLYKTVSLLVASIALIISFIIIPVVDLFPAQATGTVLYRLFSATASEQFAIIALWLLTQKYGWNIGKPFGVWYKKIWIDGKREYHKSDDDHPNSNSSTTKTSKEKMDTTSTEMQSTITK